VILLVAEIVAHGLQDGLAGVEPDQVGEGKRAERLVRAELHAFVDVLCTSNPAHQGIEGLVDHRHQHAVDDKACIVLADNTFLTELGDECCDLVDGAVSGGRSRDNFHQTHQWHRVHEVQADYFITALRAGGEAGDGDRGAVGSEDCRRGSELVEAGKDIFFQHFVFGNGFDDQFTLCQSRVVRSIGDVARGGLLCGGTDELFAA